jgi:hypothetical protein
MAGNRLSSGSTNTGALTAPIDKLTGIFWAVVNFFVIFFSTMLNMDPPRNQSQNRSWGRSTGEDGPGGPGRRMGGVDSFRQKANAPNMGVGGG